MNSINAAELGRINGNIVNIDNTNVVRHGKSTRTPSLGPSTRRSPWTVSPSGKLLFETIFVVMTILNVFSRPGATWNPAAQHHGFQAERDGLRRSIYMYISIIPDLCQCPLAVVNYCTLLLCALSFRGGKTKNPGPGGRYCRDYHV